MRAIEVWGTVSIFTRFIPEGRNKAGFRDVVGGAWVSCYFGGLRWFFSSFPSMMKRRGRGRGRKRYGYYFSRRSALFSVLFQSIIIFIIIIPMNRSATFTQLFSILPTVHLPHLHPYSHNSRQAQEQTEHPTIIRATQSSHRILANN